MAEMEETQQERAPETLQNIIRLLRKQEARPNEQNLAQLQKSLDALHPADVAYVLEALPLKQRMIVWNLVKAERDGEILLEVSDAVRETLIANMEAEELVAAAETLDTDEIADLAPDLPRDVVQDILDSMDVQNRARLQTAMAYPENTVGALMEFEVVTIRDDIKLEVVLRYLRRFDELPGHMDALFVVDPDDTLKGVLPLKRLLVSDPDINVAGLMLKEFVSFNPQDAANEAALAFERYGLVSAPVVNDQNKLVGRLTVESVVEYIREKADTQILSNAGLREEEDLFAPVRESTKNRTLWLGINLITAFAASWVTHLFEASIEKIVALAVLMTVIPSMGGNAGTQTMALVTRGLALDQVSRDNIPHLFNKEVAVAYIQGLIWAMVVGVLAALWYRDLKLSLVFGAAMIIELFAAALSGVAIPLILRRFRIDPAVGTTVILTTVTDVVGLFSFLGLATLFLV
ncbi:MAG TPA: magnesium transporter [Burkholderiales bacterium]|nr:magnesium transporter [Burkholderiales bacterium]